MGWTCFRSVKAKLKSNTLLSYSLIGLRICVLIVGVYKGGYWVVDFSVGSLLINLSTQALTLLLSACNGLYLLSYTA